MAATEQRETKQQQLVAEEEPGPVSLRNVNRRVVEAEYAVRGALLDLFPMGSQEPYRIDLFDDESLFFVDLSKWKPGKVDLKNGGSFG